MPTTEKTAFVYVRVSTEDQAREGVSLDDQMDRCRAHAAGLGASVVREFREAGKSAYQGHREIFARAIELACQIRPTYFICWSSSRFARDRLTAGIAKRQLETAGIKLVYVNMQIDPFDHSGALVDGIFEVIDEAQSRQNSMDTKRSMAKVAGMGFWVSGRPPYGFSAVRDPGQKHQRLVIDEYEATLVRKVFGLRLAGEGALNIATSLNAQGLMFRGNKKWIRSTVLHLLRSRIVTGVQVYGKKNRRTGGQRDESEWIVVPGYPAIIDETTFQQVQALLDDAGAGCGERTSATSTHLLTGMIHCGLCGAPMHVSTGKGRNERYSYYTCSAWLKRKECAPNRAPVADLDRRMAAAICAEVFHPKALAELLREVEVGAREWASKLDAQRKVIKQQIAEMRSRQSRLFDVLELHGKDAPNLADLTVRMREIKASIAALELEADRLERAEPPRVIATEEDAVTVGLQFSEALQNPQNYKRTRLWVRSFVQRIDVGQDQVTLTYDPARLVLSGAVHSLTNWLPGTDSNRRPGD